jgi:hypothetical protein
MPLPFECDALFLTRCPTALESACTFWLGAEPGLWDKEIQTVAMMATCRPSPPNVSELECRDSYAPLGSPVVPYTRCSSRREAKTLHGDTAANGALLTRIRRNPAYPGSTCSAARFSRRRDTIPLVPRSPARWIFVRQLLPHRPNRP